MAFEIADLYDATHAALASVLEADGSLRSLNETETRRHVIDPIIEALGYSSLDHVRREYRLGASGQIIDYMLLAGDERLVVEAKQLGSELGAKEGGQLVGYCAQEGIRWALLTNGIVWVVYDIAASRGDWQQKQVAHLDLLGAYRSETLGEQLKPLAFFAREALGSDDQRLIAWAHEERARTHLDRLLGQPDSPLISTAVEELARQGIDLEPDDVVSLLKSGTAVPAQEPEPARSKQTQAISTSATAVQYYVFPASAAGGFSATEHLRRWLDSGAWGVRGSTAHRKRIKAGDKACFYATGEGVVATATITGALDHEVTPEEWRGPDQHVDNVFRVPLSDVKWLDASRKIDLSLRERLDAFDGRDMSRPWSWFIQSTNRMSKHDFEVLTS